MAKANHAAAAPLVETADEVQQHPDVLEFRAAAKALAENRAAHAEVQLKLRDKAREARSLGRPRTVSFINPGSRESKQAAVAAEAAAMEKTCADLDAELTALKLRHAEARGRASQLICQHHAPAVRQLVRSLLRAGVQVDAQNRQLLAVLERISGDGFELCGPLTRIPTLNTLGRADRQSQLSAALSEAHACGFISPGESEFAYRDSVGQDEIVRRFYEVEEQEAVAKDKSFFSKILPMTTRPLADRHLSPVERLAKIREAQGGDEDRNDVQDARPVAMRIG